MLLLLTWIINKNTEFVSGHLNDLFQLVVEQFIDY